METRSPISEMEDMRARLRNAGREPATEEGYGHIYFGALAFLGFALGAAVVLFLPTLSPVTPAADIPTFQGATEAPRESVEPARAAPAAPDYTADPEKLAVAADSACFQRAQARYPSWSKTPRLTTKTLTDFDLRELKHFDELMTCLLTEAPVRYCAASQRTMIAAEIITYFRGIADLNKRLDLVRKLAATSNGSAAAAAAALPTEAAQADPRVIAAIEARLRDGLLTRSEFDQMKTVMPARLRERLATVPFGASPCPAPPWWAFWR